MHICTRISIELSAICEKTTAKLEHKPLNMNGKRMKINILVDKVRGKVQVNLKLPAFLDGNKNKKLQCILSTRLNLIIIGKIFHNKFSNGLVIVLNENYLF